MSKITFVSNSYKLSGNLFQAQRPSALAFLLIQGWMGHQNIGAAQALADLGFTSMTYDMRGNGDSEGNLADFSRADFVSDAVAAFDFLQQKVDQDVQIGVVGSSFGSYTAVLLSKERPVKCLSLRVPASYPDEGYNEPKVAQSEEGQQETWRFKKLDYTQNHAFQTLHDFKGNVQIVEADHDEIVPHQAVQNYADAVSDKLKLTHDILKDAPHRLENQRLQSDYVRLLTTWAQKQV